MSLHVRRALREGVPRVFTRNGLILLVAYFVVSLFQFGLVFAITTTVLPVNSGSMVPPASSAPTDPAPGTSLPLAVSLQAALIATFAGGLLTVPVRVVALRTFASEHRERIPDELIFRRLGWVTLNSFVGSWIVSMLFLALTVASVFLGFRALFSLLDTTMLALAGTWPGRTLLVGLTLVCLLPAVFVGVSLIFVGQQVAIEDKNVGRAVLDGWRLARGNRLRLLALALVPLVVQSVISVPLYSLLPPVPAQVISVGLSGVVTVATLAVMARAYLLVREEVPTRGAL